MIFTRTSGILLLTTLFWNAEACFGSYTLKENESIFGVAAKNFASVNVMKMCNQNLDIFNLEAGQVIKYPVCGVSKTYTVGNDDTIESIAKKFSLKVADILDCNSRLPMPGSLVPGQEIEILTDPNSRSSVSNSS